MFFRKRYPADLWVKINDNFLDFEPRIFCYDFKQEVLTWLKNIGESNWKIWGEEGDIYGVKFIRAQDATLFRLTFG